MIIIISVLCNENYAEQRLALFLHDDVCGGSSNYTQKVVLEDVITLRINGSLILKTESS